MAGGAVVRIDSLTIDGLARDDVSTFDRVRGCGDGCVAGQPKSVKGCRDSRFAGLFTAGGATYPIGEDDDLRSRIGVEGHTPMCLGIQFADGRHRGHRRDGRLLMT